MNYTALKLVIDKHAQVVFRHRSILHDVTITLYRVENTGKEFVEIKNAYKCEYFIESQSVFYHQLIDEIVT